MIVFKLFRLVLFQKCADMVLSSSLSDSAQANQGPINAALALARQKAAQLGLTKNLNAAPATPAATRAEVAQATAIAVLKGTAPPTTSGPAGSAAAAAAAAAAAVAATAAGSNSTNAAPSSRTLAEQAAEKLNAKLGYSKQLQAAPAEEETPAPAGSDMIRRYVQVFYFTGCDFQS